MNKKLKIIIYEPLLLLALPISLITLFLIVIARPFVRIRVGFLRCDRIGHFAANTEIYLCERDINKNSDKTLDLFYYPRKVCNQQLANMWERKLHVLPWFWLRPLCLVIRTFRCLTPHRVVEGRGGDIDIDNLLERLPPHLSFTAEEEARGEAGLRAIGIPTGASFVCLNIRDSAYLGSSCYDYHNYRDSDVQNYVLAAEELADRGYIVIRMGAKVHAAIKSTHPKVIDYATNGMRSDFMDIYLGAKCAFCISVGSGFDAVPFVFRRPIVYVNMMPFGLWMSIFRQDLLVITKHHFSTRINRELTLREIFTQDVGFSMSTSEYESKGVKLIENTPEEIRDAVIEMAERLEGIFEPHEDDEFLQRRFWEIFHADTVDHGGMPLYGHGEIRSRYGAHFLRNNRWWLE